MRSLLIGGSCLVLAAWVLLELRGELEAPHTDSGVGESRSASSPPAGATPPAPVDAGGQGAPRPESNPGGAAPSSGDAAALEALRESDAGLRVFERARESREYEVSRLETRRVAAEAEVLVVGEDLRRLDARLGLDGSPGEELDPADREELLSRRGEAAGQLVALEARVEEYEDRLRIRRTELARLIAATSELRDALERLRRAAEAGAVPPSARAELAAVRRRLEGLSREVLGEETRSASGDGAAP